MFLDVLCTEVSTNREKMHDSQYAYAYMGLHSTSHTINRAIYYLENEDNYQDYTWAKDWSRP